jgi:glycerophosphoryl diester phosphodiesterase
MKKISIYAILLTGLVLALLLFVVLIINYKFENLKIKHFYLGEYKVWAHRAYDNYEKENSINSINKAITKGAKGIELDLWYDNEIKDFVVSSNYPYKLENGKLLKFNELLNKIPNNIYFWLDFKNLSYMSRYDAEISGKHLLKILTNHNIKDKCIVESKNPINLSIFSGLGIFTCIEIEPKNYSNWFKYNLMLCKWKLSFIFGNISGISLYFKQYGEKILKDLPNVPIYLWTVNDREEITKFINDNSVKVILTDSDYYNMK